MRIHRMAGIALVALAAGATAAQAHVDLAITGTPGPGSTVLFGFGPGHGCDGADTTAIRIQIPAGITSVKPMAKPGWTIDLVTGADGAVTEVDFSGGSLPDAWFDQFWIRAKIDDAVAAGAHIYFPLLQECGSAVIRWLDVPAEGAAEPEEPAPGFEVGAAMAMEHAH